MDLIVKPVHNCFTANFGQWKASGQILMKIARSFTSAKANLIYLQDDRIGFGGKDRSENLLLAVIFTTIWKWSV